MKKNAKPIRLKHFLFLFCFFVLTVLMSVSLSAQVFERDVRSMYNGFAFNAMDTLSADTLMQTFVPLLKDGFAALPIENSVATPVNDAIPFPEDPVRIIPLLMPFPGDSVLRKPFPPSGDSTRLGDGAVNPANTYAVGEIPIRTEVNATGATVYNVSIDIVAGVNGFQPNISVNYNSMGGNSVLGVGWNIGGLSAISRANSNIYYNNVTKAPTFSNTDAFVLDGMRLVGTSQSAGVITYLPEQVNSNMKILGYAKHFEVFYPDGKIAVFGYPANMSTTILAYPITKLTDSYGNSITYTYTFRNGHYYIHHIDYGTGANIQFNYRTRSDITSGYLSGIKITEDYLLDNISCYDGQTLFREYTFTYNTQSNALLTQIDCGVDATNKLKPLQFAYGSGQSAAQLLNNQTKLNSWFSATTYNLVVQKGKFDSYSDNDALIVYPNKNPYEQYYKGGSIWSHSKLYFYSTFNSNQTLLVYQDIGSSSVSPATLTAGDGFIQLTSADVDGLPGDEVIKINNYVSNNRDIVMINTYKPHYIFGLAHKSTMNFDLGEAHDHYGSKSVYLKSFLIGDFNGDGKMELFVIQAQNYIIPVDNPRGYLLDLSSGNILFSGNVFTFGTTSETDKIPAQLTPMDFDGDGKTDLCHVHGSGTDIYTFENTLNNYTLVKKGATYAALNKNTFHNNDAVLLGDINGDGKTDFLVSPPQSYYTTTTTYVSCLNGNYNYAELISAAPQPLAVADNLASSVYRLNVAAVSPSLDVGNAYINAPIGRCPVTTQKYVDRGNQWTVYYTKGGATADFERTTMPICNNEAGYKFLLQDMNEDGVVDFIRRAGGYITIFLSQGGRISSTDEPQSVYVPSGAYLIPSIVANRTYHTQLLALYTDKIHKITYTRNGAQQNLLTSAVNSLGVVMQNNYARLNDNPYGYYMHYQKGYGATFPYENFDGPLWVTTATKAYYNETLLTSLSYYYENAIIHKQGLGFCGFQKKISRDERRWVSGTQTYDPYKYGIPVEEESPTVKNKYNFDILVYAGKRLKITLNNKTETDKLKGNSMVSSFLYDTYGNPTRIETAYANGDKNIVNNTYSYPSKNNYTYSLLQEQSVTNTQSNGSSVAKTNYAYNANYAVVGKKDFFNGNQVLEQTWEYDQFGNVVLQKGKPYTHPLWINSTGYTYDPLGRYVTKVTDPMQKETTFADFHVSGKPQTVTDYKGNVTNYTYDAFGRLTGAVYPDEVTAQQTMAWYAEGDALYSITGDKTGAPQSVAYYDALNRLIKQSTQGFDGSLIYTDKKYDTYGRLSEASEPYAGNAATQKTSYTYDAYDRIATIQTAQGKIINYIYSGSSTTESDGVLTSTKIYNVRGQLMGVSGSNGIVSYTYRPDGQPATVKLNNAITTSFEYDAYGRQSAIVDPAAGRQTYGYDSRGNLTQQTDANNKTVTTTYNDFGQPLARTTPELSVTYNYTDDYLLSSVVCGDNAKHFTYDHLDRMLSESETVDNLSFAKTYAYTHDKMTAATYSLLPDKPITYGYNEYGYLKEITAGGAPVWQLTSANHYGQPVHEILGNDLFTKKHTYSDEGLLAERHFQKGTATLQQQQYAFDPLKSVLNARTNHYGITETFEHDVLSQLKGVSSFGESVQMHYDEQGNITQKTDVGTYGYNAPNNPYAITEVTGYTGAIPSFAQQVSYTSFRRPAVIEEENGAHTAFTYNADWQRVKMEVRMDDTPQLTRYYLNNNYEKDITPGRTTERLYLGGTAYQAPAVFIREDNGAWALHYILRDHLGSITGIADEEGTPVAEYSYDPWGRLRDPQSLQVYAFGQEPALLLGRGFTGHEHLPWHGLVNMNARLYDPLLGRFLSPDPYVQFPDIVRSYNRYAYCLNNPLLYTDPSGEKWWHWFLGGADVLSGGVFSTTALLTAHNASSLGIGLAGFASTVPVTPGIVSGTAFAAGVSGFTVAGAAAGVGIGNGIGNMTLASIGSIFNNDFGRRMGNAWKLSWGMFKTDKDLNFFRRYWQFISRYTYEMPVTAFGQAWHGVANAFSSGDINVGYFHGATVLQADWMGDGGVTIGSNITIGYDSGDINADNPTLLHEYGHYLQTRAYGAIPWLNMALSSVTTPTGQHKENWTEQDANYRSMRYFQNKITPKQYNNFLTDSYYAEYFKSYNYRFWFSSLFSIELISTFLWRK